MINLKGKERVSQMPLDPAGLSRQHCLGKTKEKRDVKKAEKPGWIHFILFKNAE